MASETAYSSHPQSRLPNAWQVLRKTTKKNLSAFQSSGMLRIVDWFRGKVKVKFHPRTGHEGPERKERYSSTLSVTSAVDGVGGQLQAPAALTR